jgi:hypothetical protein
MSNPQLWRREESLFPDGNQKTVLGIPAHTPFVVPTTLSIMYLNINAINKTGIMSIT